MDAAKEYLAEGVLVEKRINAKKAGSVHATYLLYGTKQAAENVSHSQNDSSDEGDVEMEESLPEYLQSERVIETVMTLVAEENLEYSVRQLHELRGANAQDEDPKVFGTIPNSHAQRRQRKGQGPIAAGAATASASAAKPKQNDAPGPNSVWNKVNKASAKEDDKPATTTPKPAAITEPTKTTSSASSSASNAPPPLKRAGSSGGRNIMQAFAKGASAVKPKKPDPAPLAKKAEDEDMTMDMSDDGGDDDGGGAENLLPKAKEVIGGKSRQQREEELRKMMEDDDDDDDAEDERNKEDEREDTPMEDVVEEKPVKNDGPSEVVTASAGDGRRRGKRRVARKKMIEDKDGYLVTIQEEGWESFSEDEAPPSKVPAVATPASSASSSAPKQKAPAAKKGQGNIMSFFAKK
ncbi:CDC27 protein [Sporothrix epigloea]|uniref:CDC27 protein n=1 Tax=Sporothrix epigloea TaxID=1892477 RepID=A0ABP0E3F2_9PEZI